MKLNFIKPVFAHCDLPCGVYDPAQARIEAQSVHEILKKYPDLSEQDKWRAIMIKEQRLELVKHHLWVLWTDYFKLEHFEKYKSLHTLLWKTTKMASILKKSTNTDDSQRLLDMIYEVTEIFNMTKA